jgi:hypothetical protein
MSVSWTAERVLAETIGWLSTSGPVSTGSRPPSDDEDDDDEDVVGLGHRGEMLGKG